MSTILNSTREELVRIKQWIEKNQHKYKNGITYTTMFSEVVKISGSEEFYPPHINQQSPLYTRYCAKMNCYRKQGYLKRVRLTPNGKLNWVVNERVINEDMTGVTHTIPFTPPVPKKSESQEKNEQAAAEFIMSELKSIKVRHALLVNNNKASIRLTDVTLYDVYKIGLSLEKTLGTEHLPSALRPIQADLEAQEDEQKVAEAEGKIEEGEPF